VIDLKKTASGGTVYNLEPYADVTQGLLTFRVKYSSRCEGGQSFTAHVMKPHEDEEREEGGTAILDDGKVLYVHREDACEGEAPEQEYVRTVSAKLPTGAVGWEFLAFPPGGAYDMYKIQFMTDESA